ncbi:galactokinase [Devriesea agamarum]|uniref:galactokinase n=1 Tax=Devriesea agamarum TaxID=472569 RepID=UPI00071C2629|nr:galactokinase [Devriesea agamarum]
MNTSPSPIFTEAPDRVDAAARVSDQFVEVFGYSPDGVWSAPGRVNIIGEHVDYQDGLCLPMAIEHRCFVAAARTPADVVRLRSVQSDEVFEGNFRDLAPGEVPGWAAYVAGVLWAVRPYMAGSQPGGVDILVDGYVPLGSGLSSSASLECSVVTTVDSLLSLGMSDAEKIRAAIRAETEFAGASTGGLDQSASVLCTEGHAIVLDCRDISTRSVPWDLGRQGLALLVIDTKAEHSHVDGEYVARRRDSEAAAKALGVATLREVQAADLDSLLPRIEDETVRRRARHVVTEIQRVRDFADLLNAGTVRAHVDALGALMNASHNSLRDDYEVTCKELDLAVDTARSAGAYGARMTGGGFGGSAIALVEEDKVQETAQAIADAFAAQGLRAPQFIVSIAADGAGQDR